MIDDKFWTVWMSLTTSVGDQLSFTQKLESTSTLSTAKPRPETDLSEGTKSSSSVEESNRNTAGFFSDSSL